MSLQYIIDGCNVIHHPDFIKKVSKKQVDFRVALVKLIMDAGLCPRQNSLIWIVFDGFPQQDLSAMGTKRIKILFSRNQSADEKIKRILELTDNLKGTSVVSDDKEIILFSRIMHARPLSVKDFIRYEEAETRQRVVLDDKKINYSQMCRINEELKRLWLKEE